jgi:hypothetical protein
MATFDKHPALIDGNRDCFRCRFVRLSESARIVDAQ